MLDYQDPTPNAPTVDRKAIDRKLWLVLPHAERGKLTGGGYVVRPGETQLHADDRFNYGGIDAVACFITRKSAEKYAEKLNKFGGIV